MSLIALIQSVLPNFSDKQLRSMVPWFKAVSAAVDNNIGGLVAAAHIDGAGTFQMRYGFDTPVTHGSTGNYRFTFTETQDVNLLVPMAVITNPGTPAGAINAYPSLVDGDSIDVNVWQIAATTAARSQVDQDLFIIVTRIPSP